MKEIKAYLANQFGFSETGKYVLDNLIIPKLKKMGLTVFDPFEECGKNLDLECKEKLEKEGKYQEVRNFWEGFISKIGQINQRLLQQSDCLLAILDGGHSSDDGVSNEIGRYSEMKRGPVFALRTDFRLCENMASSVNVMLLDDILKTGGKLCKSIDEWFSEIEKWCKNKDDKKVSYDIKINTAMEYYGYDHYPIFGYELTKNGELIKKEECKYKKLKNCLKNASKELEKIIKE